MKILLVIPAIEFSVLDVARGYHNAFIRAGHTVWTYDLGKRMAYHARAMPEKAAACVPHVTQMASENLVVEALKCEADVVVIVSGLMCHPLGVQLLYKAHIPTVVIHTESPYEDAAQAEWGGANPDAQVFTHERISAEQCGWGYLPHAYDRDIHKPVKPVEPCDVLFLGTGWPERIALLEAVDWTGIDLKIRGLWNTLRADSPLRPFYVDGCVDNTLVPGYYAGAKINLNIHRAHETAESLNPRAYELAACGAFCLSDYRRDSDLVFQGSQPWFHSAASLEALVRRYLDDDGERARAAARARELGHNETFDTRAADLLSVLHTAVVAA